MRAASRTAARIALLAGPTVLSFFAGGYFQQPGLWAGLGAWLVVLVALLAARGTIPRSRTVWLAIGGLAGLASWTLLSTAWAPIRGDAYHAGQEAILYLGVLIAATLLFRQGPPALAVEPALAAGIVVVVGYGISERLLPGLLHFARSFSAEGRLEQPLTYWNAMGEMAAIGFVLCARLMGDPTRGRPVRVCAVAGATVLGLGVFLSVSRGALFACLAGLVTLIVAAPRWEQLRSVALALGAGALAALAASPLDGVTRLAGTHTARERQGAIMLAALVAIVGVAGAVQWMLCGRERPAGASLPLPRRAAPVALGLLLVGLAVAIVVGNHESSRSRTLSAGTARLETLRSDRYAYWRVALRAFEAEPLRGVGAGGWAVYWLGERTNSGGARDAHSLELQTLAELGIVGLALLAAFIAGCALAVRTAHRLVPALAAGPIAGAVAYAAHSPLDWDWQMPALALIAMILLGTVLALAQSRPPAADHGSPAIGVAGASSASASPGGVR